MPTPKHITWFALAVALALAESDFDKLVRELDESGKRYKILVDEEGNRTVHVPDEVYVSKARQLARQRQQAKAKQKRRAAAKQGQASRARNRR